MGGNLKRRRENSPIDKGVAHSYVSTKPAGSGPQPPFAHRKVAVFPACCGKTDERALRLRRQRLVSQRPVRGSGRSMIPKGGNRFSDKIMLNQKVRACFTL